MSKPAKSQFGIMLPQTDRERALAKFWFERGKHDARVQAQIEAQEARAAAAAPVPTQLTACSECDELVECFETRAGEALCFDCAAAECERARADAEADRGDDIRKAEIEEGVA